MTMRQYKISPEENDRTDSKKIWSISIPSTTLPSTNHNENPPTYNEFMNSSSNHLNDLPPSYIDLSIIPRGMILYYDEVIPYTEPSKAIIVRRNGNILSFDSLIDKNPDQLWLYFMTYLNEKPSLSINAYGYHIEAPMYRSAGLRNGSYNRVVTDFNYSIDLTPYVSEHYLRIAVIPSKKSKDKNEIITFRDTLEQYTHSERYFKEIQCEKQIIGWNFKELKQKIKDIIFSTGYGGHISVSFTMDKKQIIARSPSKLIHFANTLWIRILCFLSCFCLIFAPIYFYLRRLGSTRHHIVADYNMKSSPRNFLRKNSGLIRTLTTGHSKGRFLAKFA